MEDISTEGVASFQKELNGDHISSGDELLQNIPTIVTDAHNAFLIAFPSTDEVYNIVQDMDENSVAGPDDYNDFFYKTC